MHEGWQEWKLAIVEYVVYIFDLIKKASATLVSSAFWLAKKGLILGHMIVHCYICSSQTVTLNGPQTCIFDCNEEIWITMRFGLKYYITHPKIATSYPLWITFRL